MTTGTTASRNFVSGNVATFTAGGTIPYGAFVKLDSTEGQVVVTTAITDRVVGVSMGTYASADRCEIQTGGIAPVLIASAVALGAEVYPDAGGGGKAAGSATPGATAVSCGLAVTQGDTDAQLIKVLLRPMVKCPANT
jgi:hypothetical protein